MSSTLFVLVAFFLSDCTGARVEQEEKGKSDSTQTWSYRDLAGWKKVSGQMCDHKDDQSPIDIETECVSYDTKLTKVRTVVTSKTDANEGETMVTTNAHTWQIETKGSHNGMILDGTPYSLDQIHFHSPSENTIDGRHFPLEAHLVHTSGKKIAVVSQMFTVKSGSIDHAYLKKFWDYFPPVEGSVKASLPTGNPYTELLVPETSYYRWTGSLTTPPCTNNVQWLLMQNIAEMSNRQLASFRESLSAMPDNQLRVEIMRPKGLGRGVEWSFGFGVNNRPVQSLGDRVIRGYNPLIQKSKMPEKCKKKKPLWNYRELSRWSHVDHSSMCGHLSDQSPINIVQKCINYAEPVPKMEFSVFAVEAVAKTSEHTWELGFSGEANVIVDGSKYTLGQLHFHSPSENTIDGNHFPLEIHFVHVNGTGNILVISQMVKLPKKNTDSAGNNPYLESIWSKFPRRVSTREEEFTVGDPYHELLVGDAYIKWTGSLTTPPCTNNVQWILMQDVAVMSRRQLNMYREGINKVRHNQLVVKTSVPRGINAKDWDVSLGVNNRPLQPLAGRKLSGFDPKSENRAPPPPECFQ
eukprot:TRINITY_DN2999_c0_g1_i1.p1 TRINITY_DN2999_c0_g1~~TRINITY_DN2999_c0_g1_i1.p1  ORF type:complete len:615 (-),score=66.44 TRINITY_DN2999_c0_g1_i1:56-1792(-)